MSLITSCPACGTMFRVVPDQLKISEGWVRCGHCGEIFDAAATLTQQPVTPPPTVAPPVATPAPMAPAAQPVVLPPPDPVPTPVPAPASAPIPAASLVVVEAAEAPEAAGPHDAPAEAPLPGPERPVPYRPAVGNPGERGGNDALATDSELLEESPRDLPFVFRRSDLVADVEDGEGEAPEPPPEPTAAPARVWSRRARAAREAEVDETRPLDSELESVSFVRQARRRAFWRQPLVRIALVFAGLMLAALLALQVAYQERDRLALAVPALAPPLEQLCELAGCRLGPPRQIEAVVIESSTFNKLRNDTYRLSLALRSTASLPIAMPALELTLTDGQDQPVLRRVLLPAELGARTSVLAPGADLPLTVGIVVAAPANARVAGYRLLAFYP